MKEEKWHQYKMLKIQLLYVEDKAHRFGYAENQFKCSNKILDISDESYFSLHWQCDRHNIRYWSNVNPHW